MYCQWCSDLIAERVRTLTALHVAGCRTLNLLLSFLFCSLTQTQTQTQTQTPARARPPVLLRFRCIVPLNLSNSAWAIKREKAKSLAFSSIFAGTVLSPGLAHSIRVSSLVASTVMKTHEELSRNERDKTCATVARREIRQYTTYCT